MQGFVVDAALRMPAVVSCVTVAAALTAGRRAEHPVTLFEFIQPEIEEPRLLAIDKCDPKTRLSAKQQSQRLQMELAVHEKLGSGQLRRQIELAPEIAAAAGKHGSSARLVAVKILGHFQDSIQVGPGAAILAGLLRLVQCAANQIFRENGFFVMRFVLRGARLEIETQRRFVSAGVKLS